MAEFDQMGVMFWDTYQLSIKRLIVELIIRIHTLGQGSSKFWTEPEQT
jgi:hypothetical protein